MDIVFVDSGYWLALELGKDQNHPAAIKHWRSLSKRLPRLVTTSYVFDEVTTFLKKRGHHDRAVEVGERLLRSSSVDFIHVDESLFQQAWRLFGKRADKPYSFTDCVSFALMTGRKIERALTFDKHFRQRRFPCGAQAVGEGNDRPSAPKDRGAALKLVNRGEYPRDGKLDVAELAAYAAVCNTLLNLDEVITKE